MPGKFRVKFRLLGQEFFTEWVDSRDEAMHFVHTSAYSREVFPLCVLDGDGNIV